MRIIVDVMSGDHAPEELIKGAALAAKEFDVDITVVGNREIIRKIAFVNGYDISGITIEHAKSVIDMEDAPLTVVRQKKDSSMSVGLRMLADGKGDAFVSAGCYVDRSPYQGHSARRYCDCASVPRSASFDG